MTTTSKIKKHPLWNLISDFSTGTRKAVRFSGMALLFAYIFGAVHPNPIAEYFTIAIYALWFALVLVEIKERLEHFDAHQLTVSGAIILFVSFTIPLGIQALLGINPTVLLLTYILIVIPISIGAIVTLSWLTKDIAWANALLWTVLASGIFGFIVSARIDQTDLHEYRTLIAFVSAVIYGVIQHYCGWKLADKPQTPYRILFDFIFDFSGLVPGITRASVIFYALATIAMQKYDLALFDILSFASSIVMSTALYGEFMYRTDRKYTFTAFISTMFIVLIAAFPATHDVDILFSAWMLFLTLWLAAVCATPWYTHIEGVNDIYARLVGAVMFSIIVMFLIAVSYPMNDTIDPEEIQRLSFLWPFVIAHILFGAVTSGHID